MTEPKPNDDSTEWPKAAEVKVQDLSGTRRSYLDKILVYGAAGDRNTVADAVSVEVEAVREVYDEAEDRYDLDHYEDGDVLARVTLGEDREAIEVEWAEEGSPL